MLQKEGLSKLVEHNNKKVAERQLDELKVQLTDMISGDPPASMEELLDAVKSKKAEFQLQDTDIIKVGNISQAVQAVRTGHCRQSGGGRPSQAAY